jgi:hypothetical protein
MFIVTSFIRQANSNESKEKNITGEAKIIKKEQNKIDHSTENKMND